MGKNIKSATWKKKINKLLALIVLFLLPFSIQAQNPILLDQTLAVVDKEVINLRDVEIEILMNKLLSKKIKSHRDLTDIKDKELKRGREALIRRELILRHLRQIEVNQEGLQTRIQNLKKSLLALFTSKAKMERYFQSKGVSMNEANEWIDKRARSELFLEKHLSFRLSITETDLKAHYEKQKSRRFLGKSFKKVRAIVEADLRKERLEIEFEKWLETETSRINVTRLPLEWNKHPLEP